MDWVADFYRAQYEWADRRRRWASFDPNEPDPRVESVRRLAGAGPKRILELGSGTGTTAAALAHAGHDVVAVELLRELADHTNVLASEIRGGSLRAVAGDFYSVEVDGRFDVVCYFDGFGIGSDDDQRTLLRRIAGWLTPHGCALVDVFTPWYWLAAAGNEEEFPAGSGVWYRDGFEHEGERMTEAMWRVEDPADVRVQSLRCYSPASLSLLLDGTGLTLDVVEPHRDEGSDGQVRLADSMLYLARLVAG